MKINHKGVEVILEDNGKGYGFIKAKNGAKFETFDNKLTLGQLIWIIKLVSDMHEDEEKEIYLEETNTKPFKIKVSNNIVCLEFNAGLSNKYTCSTQERAIQFGKELEETIEFLKNKTYNVEYQSDAIRFYGEDLCVVIGCSKLVYGEE